MTAGQVRRIRWAVRLVLLLGVAASVTANVLHAERNPIAEAIAAWPPLALLLTVELISRIPVHRRGLAAVRIVATAVIAGIAAWVSYWHMAGVAARYGEAADAAHLIPFSVDGLVVVASVCLVELAGRLRDLGEGATLESTLSGEGAVRERVPVDHGQDARGSALAPTLADARDGGGSELLRTPAVMATLDPQVRQDLAGYTPPGTQAGDADASPGAEARRGVLPVHIPAPVLVATPSVGDGLPEAESEAPAALGGDEGSTKYGTREQNPAAKSGSGSRVSEPAKSSSRRTVSDPKSRTPGRNTAPRRNPELTRRLVIAATVDGLKPAEIAESLGLSVRRVNQLLKPVDREV